MYFRLEEFPLLAMQVAAVCVTLMHVIVIIASIYTARIER